MTVVLHSSPRLKNFAPTKYLNKCPRLKAAINAIPGEKLSVRLTALPSGSGLSPHRDNWKSFEHGVLRLHIPIETNRKAKFVVAKKNVKMTAGELWYCDFSRVHYVKNFGQTPRIHLVLDVKTNEDLMKLFPPSLRFKFNQKKVQLPPSTLPGKTFKGSVILPPHLFDCGVLTANRPTLFRVKGFNRSLIFLTAMLPLPDLKKMEIFFHQQYET